MLGYHSLLLFLIRLTFIASSPIPQTALNPIINITNPSTNSLPPLSYVSPDMVEDWETIEDFRQSLRLTALKNNPKGADVLRSFVSQQNSTCDEVNWYNVVHHSIFGKKRFCDV